MLRVWVSRNSKWLHIVKLDQAQQQKQAATSSGRVTWVTAGEVLSSAVCRVTAHCAQRGAFSNPI
jgi:hypothetical protein